MNRLFRKIVLIILFLLVTGGAFTGCGLLYALGRGTGTGTYYVEKEDALEYKVEKTVVEPITSITIHSNMSEVELVEADDFYVEIDYLYWEKKPTYTLEDGNLVFDDKGILPASYSINFQLNNKIKIYLPESAILSSLHVENNMGKVNLSGFKADDMEVLVSYGNIEIKEAAAAQMDFTLSYGTGTMTDFQVGKMNFNNTYSNISFTDINIGEVKRLKDIFFDNIDITMSGGDADIDGLRINSININNSYGNMNCEDIMAEDFDMELSYGNLEISKADLKNAEINGSFSDVTFGLIGAREDYSLELSSSMGDNIVDGINYGKELIQDNHGKRSVIADMSNGNVVIRFED